MLFIQTFIGQTTGDAHYFFGFLISYKTLSSRIYGNKNSKLMHQNNPIGVELIVWNISVFSTCWNTEMTFSVQSLCLVVQSCERQLFLAWEIIRWIKFKLFRKYRAIFFASQWDIKSTYIFSLEFNSRNTVVTLALMVTLFCNASITTNNSTANETNSPSK